MTDAAVAALKQQISDLRQRTNLMKRRILALEREMLQMKAAGRVSEKQSPEQDSEQNGQHSRI